MDVMDANAPQGRSREAVVSRNAQGQGPLRVLHVNSTDVGGGAERVALDLVKDLRNAGHSAGLAVGREGRTATPRSASDAIDLIELTDPVDGTYQSVLRKLDHRLAPLAGRFPGPGRARVWVRRLARRRRLADWWKGRECFDWPGSHRLLYDTEENYDILHIHNVHGDYFDLTILPDLSRRIPVVITLHDEWLMTGHCSNSKTCERLFHGCGQCPDLETYPAVRRDATADNWLRKQQIYSQCNVAVVSPSHWLLERAKASILAAAVHRWATIPNSVDVGRFRPGDPGQARQRLGLPQDNHIFLFAASGGTKNPMKDVETVRRAVVEFSRYLPKDTPPPVFLLLGGDGHPKKADNIVEWPLRIPSYSDLLPEAFRAADLYLHAAHAENFPIAVLEALASGLPVVATAVGGIKDQFPALTTLSTGSVAGEDEATAAGVLVDRADAIAMARAAIGLLNSPSLRCHIGKNARCLAEKRYRPEQQRNAYVDLYRNILADWNEPCLRE
ncbi:glycosyltransferase [Rhodospira trueperi]|uniref:Glycosyltransferase involved in cell wall bisynthesis n=1 Tax=Rhodospira trueperi TaxID=69960 RepID=A0A1G7GR01_9PROT|nr:glycosyltransferase [Rhodospira trueperi]SDE90473.1 Glycosyltransferase involved in cell wall bisynthesis [Rhodospira trueperi]